MYSVSLWSAGQEHFEDGETVEPYDTFYADIYNILWHPKEKLGFEEVSIQDIALAGQPQATVKILDMACGTAPHACWFKNLGVDFTGIEAKGLSFPWFLLCKCW